MHKQLMIMLAWCGFLYNTGMAQDEERNKLGFYPTVSLLTAFPAGTFKSDFDRNVLYGFNVDGVITPVKKMPFWQAGVQGEFLYSFGKRDTWNSLKVKTKSNFIKLNLINRIRPTHTGKMDPFFEFAYGLNIGSTNTSYKTSGILNAILFDEDTEKVDLEDYTDLSSNLGIGIGAFIEHRIVVQVKYNLSPEIGFVRKENIVVGNNYVEYTPTKADMHTISLSIGISFR